MHGKMSWGHDPHRRYSGAGMDFDVPLVPAPHVWVALIIGMVIGMMVGHKKTMMVQAHRGMMHGGGHGMGMRCGDNGAWMMRKKAMMRGMAMHHHHGTGGGPCWCGAEGQQGKPEEPETQDDRPGE